MSNYPPFNPGQAGFASIRRRGGLYVDKTPFLRLLLRTAPVAGDSRLSPVPSNGHLFLARPRRFGKSLLIDMLETWFQGLSPHRSAELADGEPNTMDVPDGWSSPAWLWDGLDAAEWHGHHGWHPVVRRTVGGQPSNCASRATVKVSPGAARGGGWFALTVPEDRRRPGHHARRGLSQHCVAGGQAAELT